MSARAAAQLFNAEVRPGLIGPPSDREQPLFVAIGGQPGIGKTTAQLAIRRQLGLGSAYLLDGDDFHPHWPGHAEAVRRNSFTAAYLAGEALGNGHWWQRAARLLRAQRRDVVSTFPMAFPGWDLPRLQEFRDFPRAPYRTIAVYVVGPEALSLQGIALRFPDIRRWVLPETHDRALPGTLDTAGAIYEQRAAHELHGMRRDGTLIYSNQQVDGEWQLGIDPRHVFETERQRPLDVESSAQFLRGQGELRDVAARAPEWGPLVDSIDQRALPVISPLVLLSDDDLAARLRLMPAIRERAVLDAERHGVTRDLLSQLHASGEIDRQAQRMERAGMSAAEVERWRSLRRSAMKRLTNAG